MTMKFNKIPQDCEGRREGWTGRSFPIDPPSPEIPVLNLS